MCFNHNLSFIAELEASGLLAVLSFLPQCTGYFCGVCSKHLKSQNALKCYLYQRPSREDRDAAKLRELVEGSVKQRWLGHIMIPNRGHLWQLSTARNGALEISWKKS